MLDIFFCFAVPCVLSGFAIILLEKRELVALLLLCSECPFRCYCHLSLPQGAVGWSVVCACGISSLYFFNLFNFIFSFAEDRFPDWYKLLFYFYFLLHTVNAFLWGGICSHCITLK